MGGGWLTGQKPIKIWGDGSADVFRGGVNWFVIQFGGIGYSFDWEGWGAKQHNFFGADQSFVKFLTYGTFTTCAFLHKYPLQ